MSAVHTAGPWQRHYSSSSPDEWVIGGEGFAPVIAFVTRDEEDDMPGATVEANARLIAAAPELLAAARAAYEMSPFHEQSCEGLVEYEEGSIFDERVGCDCFLGRLKAAIYKAEGLLPNGNGR